MSFSHERTGQGHAFQEGMYGEGDHHGGRKSPLVLVMMVHMAVLYSFGEELNDDLHEEAAKDKKACDSFAGRIDLRNKIHHRDRKEKRAAESQQELQRSQLYLYEKDKRTRN